MLRMRTCTLSLLLLGTAALQAQQTPGWKAGAALPYSLDSLHTYTHQRLVGLCADASYQIPVNSSGNFLRFSAGIQVFPGSEQTSGTLTRKASFTGQQIGADVIVPFGGGSWALVAGLTLNNWQVNCTQRDTSDPAVEGTSGSLQKPFGKIGFRTGFEYTLSKTLAIQALFQQTELGSDARLQKQGDDILGYQGINPSWVQIGIRFSF